MDKSLDYFTRSLEIQMEISTDQELSMIYNNIAGIYRLIGKNDGPTRYVKLSIKKRKKVNDVLALGESYHTYGQILTYNEEHSLAFEMLSLSLDIRDNIGNNIDTSETLFSIIILLLIQRDIATVKEYIHLILQMEDDDNPIVHKRVSVITIIENCIDQLDFDIFRDFNFFELIAKDDNTDYDLTIHHFEDLCQIICNSGNTDSDNVDETNELINDLLVISKKSESSEIMIELYLLQTQLLRSQNKFELANEKIQEALKLVENHDLDRYKKKLIC